MNGRILRVPYRSQLDPETAKAIRKDCGPTCVSMILAASGHIVTSDAITAASNVVGDNGLSLDQVVTGAGAFSLKMFWQVNLSLDDLRRFLDNGQPPIALIKYANIPDRLDVRYKAGHFVVVTGYDDETKRLFINDPDYPPGSRGHQRPYSYQTFKGAWGGFAPGENPNFCLIIPQPLQPVPGSEISRPPVNTTASTPAAAPTGDGGAVWVAAPEGLTLRIEPNTLTQIVTDLTYGQRLAAFATESNAGRTWRQVRTESGLVGWLISEIDGERYLSGKELPAPHLVTVLDTKPVRDATGLAVRDKRDIDLFALERAQIGERLLVFESVTGEDGAIWLLVKGPRGHFGWARQTVANITLVEKFDLEAAASKDTSSSTPSPKPVAVPDSAPAADSGDVWVIAPAGLALRTQASRTGTLVTGVPFGQRMTALGAQTAPDSTSRVWQQVRTEANLQGWVIVRFEDDRYLSNKQPSAPHLVEVLDTEPVRRAGGLALRDKRDIDLSALDRVQIGERLTVFSDVQQNGATWLWVQGPRGHFGWARETAGNTTLVRRIDKATAKQQKPVAKPPVDVRPFGKSLTGLGMGNPQPLTPGQLKIIENTHVEAFKTLTLPDPGENTRLIAQLKNIRPQMFIVTRLFFSVDHTSKTKFSAQEFVNFVSNGITPCYNAGVRYFEVHNEPNLMVEGMGWNWGSGKAFGDWLIAALDILRQKFPDAKFGYPGLSPQDNTPEFLKTSLHAIKHCDWVAAHSYWQTADTGPFPITSEEAGMYWRRIHATAPDKLLMITEFSNNSGAASPTEKGKQYLRYYKLLRDEQNVGAAFAFALNWPGQDNNREGWESGGQETDIAKTVGKSLAQTVFFV